MAEFSAFISDERFSRVFELPSDPASGRTGPFRVKFADYGYRNEAHPEQENVMLFFGPLMGSRLIHIAKDDIAKKHKVRIINPDRPGVGGTDALDARDGMRVWREVILALLQHLGIPYVSVACHSGGTVSAVDILVHHPEILHPERPYVAIAAPWILPKHTSSTALAIAQSLPASVLNHTDKAARLINNHIGPLVGASFGISYGLAAKVLPAQTTAPALEATAREGTRFEERIWPLVIERIYAEGVRGLSSDAILFMQKGRTTGWSDWGDYDTAVRRIAENLRAAGKRLTVDVFYAEKDRLIGDGGSEGPRWLDQCWAPYGDVFDYRSTTVQGADHDAIWKLKWGAAQAIFQRVGVE